MGARLKNKMTYLLVKCLKILKQFCSTKNSEAKFLTAPLNTLLPQLHPPTHHHLHLCFEIVFGFQPVMMYVPEHLVK